jgi:hypothetical protein
MQTLPGVSSDRTNRRRCAQGAEPTQQVQMGMSADEGFPGEFAVALAERDDRCFSGSPPRFHLFIGHHVAITYHDTSKAVLMRTYTQFASQRAGCRRPDFHRTCAIRPDSADVFVASEFDGEMVHPLVAPLLELDSEGADRLFPH